MSAVYIASDHRGRELENFLCEKFDFMRRENLSFDPEDDFNDAANFVAEKVLKSSEPSFGVLICGSGQGVAMQANRHKGIRAAICQTETDAAETKKT